MGIYNDGVAAGEAGGFIRGLREGRKKGLMEGYKKGFREGYKKGLKEGISIGENGVMFRLVLKNKLSPADAAAELNISHDEFDRRFEKYRAENAR